jgi:hypothetical protein
LADTCNAPKTCANPPPPCPADPAETQTNTSFPKQCSQRIALRVLYNSSTLILISPSNDISHLTFTFFSTFTVFTLASALLISKFTYLSIQFSVLNFRQEVILRDSYFPHKTKIKARMRCSVALFAIVATVAIAAPLPQPDAGSAYTGAGGSAIGGSDTTVGKGHGIDALNIASGNAGDGGDSSSGTAFGGDAWGK